MYGNLFFKIAQCLWSSLLLYLVLCKTRGGNLEDNKPSSWFGGCGGGGKIYQAKQKMPCNAVQFSLVQYVSEQISATQCYVI